MEDKIKLVVVFFVVAFVIHIYGIVLYKRGLEDPLIYRSNFMGLGNFLNGWAISHFVFFAFIGYYFEDYFWEAMGLGIGWELYENYFEVLFPGVVKEMDTDWGSWCYGCYEDIIMNFLGFRFGKWVKGLVDQSAV